MAWTVQTARVRAGLQPSDGTKDVELQEAMDLSLAVAEMWCDRKFFEAREIARFMDVYTQGTLALPRRPITQVHSVRVDNFTTYEYLDPTKPFDWAGVTVLGSLGLIRVWRGAHMVEIDYTGGFATLPMVVEAALWDIFAGRWAAASGDGGGSVVTSGEIKDIALDGARVSFTTSADAASADAEGLAVYLPDAARALLSSYRTTAMA